MNSANGPSAGIVAVLAILGSSVGDLFAQGTRADYERARSLDERTRDRVFRASVNSHWLPGNTKFWYRVDTGADQFEFVMVDAQAGTREPAFDHRRLASALAKSAGEPVVARKLPFRSIQFNNDVTVVRFQAFGKRWEYTLDGDEVREWTGSGDEEPSLAAETRPRPTMRDGPETSVRFENRSGGEVWLFWIDRDGQRAAYGSIPAGGEHEQHTYAGHVWLIQNAESRVLAVFEASDEPSIARIDGRGPQAELRRDSGPRAGRDRSPDGKWQVVAQNHELHLRDLKSGETVPLTTDGNAEDSYSDNVWWSPDSKRLAGLQVKAGENRQIHFIESSPRDRLQPRLHTFSYAKPGDRMPVPKPGLFDIEGKRPIEIPSDLFPNAWSITELRWNPDASEFRFLYNQRGHQLLRVIAVDAATAKPRVVVEEQSKTFVDYAHKVFYHPIEATSEIVWMSERDGWCHLYLYDAKTGKVKNQITKGSWVVRGVERVDEEERQIWFRVSGIRPEQDPYYVHLCRVNFDGSSLVTLTEGDGTHRWLWSPDRKYLIDTWSRVDQPPVTELRDADDGRFVCMLEKADWRALLATGWTPPERFGTKGRDRKTEIHGIIIRPSRFEAGRQYPVIEKIYAGPQSSFVPKEFGRQVAEHALAELGFIVVQIDGMGTSNRSKAFHDVCWKNLGDAGFPDRIAWLKSAAEKYPEMDLSRVGIFGGSAGGQNALRALLAHGDFYKVGAADCGCHDNRMDKIWWNELWMGFPIGPHYEEQSNVTQAHRLQGKLLLIVGEMDRNVDPASTMQVASALVKADKDFDLLIVPGVGHGAAGTPYAARRQTDFFVRHLLGVEPRWTP